MGLPCVPSLATASLIQIGSPLAVHMPQDIGPDVSPLAQTQPVGTACKGMPGISHRMEDPHSQGGGDGEGIY